MFYASLNKKYKCVEKNNYLNIRLDKNNQHPQCYPIYTGRFTLISREKNMKNSDHSSIIESIYFYTCDFLKIVTNKNLSSVQIKSCTSLFQSCTWMWPQVKFINTS